MPICTRWECWSWCQWPMRLWLARGLQYWVTGMDPRTTLLKRLPPPPSLRNVFWFYFANHAEGRNCYLKDHGKKQDTVNSGFLTLCHLKSYQLLNYHYISFQTLADLFNGLGNHLCLIAEQARCTVTICQQYFIIFPSKTLSHICHSISPPLVTSWAINVVLLWKVMQQMEDEHVSCPIM